jgi:hypothetical protein
LAQTYQALVAGGVKSINLDHLRWDSINVSGSTATAITTETWTRTYDNGTTSVFTATNVYTLVREGDTWLIDRDESDAVPT